MKSRIKAKNAVIEKQWDGDLQITAVAGELRQVFSNLLANSLHAIDDMGVITIRASRSPVAGARQVRITVADNGRGIDFNARQQLVSAVFHHQRCGGHRARPLGQQADH
jgi:signal transduction histidine kinase